MVGRFAVLGSVGTLMAMIAVTGCTKQTASSEGNAAQPVVLSINTQNQPMSAEIAAATARIAKMKAGPNTAKADKGLPARMQTAATVVSSRVTFDRAGILGKVFLFGSDLQYSTIGESDGGILLQALALGHATARFQVVGDRLQLLADERYRYESNINTPVRLLNEWPIVAQTPDTLTVEMSKASPSLSTVLGGQNPALHSWIRSVEYIQDGNYLLIESSMVMADGTVTEFMESVFPRETLVANAPAAQSADPSVSPWASRFAFLANGLWGDVNGKRAQTAVAQRFPVPPVGKTIDWYVTSNVPIEYLEAIRDGVEGWNRYSQKMWGRDFVSFKGLVPAGVKIGDPRYNIINWDSVGNAGAAYESQAADVETGLQSHSLIYLPFSWIKIGREFWERGEIANGQTTAELKGALDRADFIGRKVAVNCFHEGEMLLGPILPNDPDMHAKELLKGVLFHEMGHALGLGHNFKGSLEWDPSVAGAMFSSTIMDYNQYQIEGMAFDGPGKSTGPLLEYDRQILSVLYNDGKDVAVTDRFLPVCTDRDADSKTGGVDPFCIRYDAGEDPSMQLVRTLNLIEDPTTTVGTTKSLALAADKIVQGLPDPKLVTNDAELMAAESAAMNKFLALNQYYVSAGGQSLAYMLTQNLRMLLVYRVGSLPMVTDTDAIRTRVVGTVNTMMRLENFSAATHQALAKTGDAMATWLQQTAWFANANAVAQTEHGNALKMMPDRTLGMIESAVVPRIRARMLQGLVRSTSAPFFLSATADYEQIALKWLDTALTGTLPSGTAYSLAERVAAATAIASYSAVPEAADVKMRARRQVLSEIKAASTAESREALRALASLLL